MGQKAACNDLRCHLWLHHSHSWQPHLPTTMGFFQPGTSRGMFSMTMGSLKTVPFSMFLQAGGSMAWGGVTRGEHDPGSRHMFINVRQTEATERPGQQGRSVTHDRYHAALPISSNWQCSIMTYCSSCRLSCVGLLCADPHASCLSAAANCSQYQ